MMTSEKAIELLHRLQDEQFDGVHGDERREALDMAVRALEPNLGNNGSICIKTGANDEDRTTDDCISRQAAIDAVVSAMIDGADAELVEGVMELLPSAQPERKKGKWIEHNPHNWGLGIIYECSECGYEMDCEEPNYCPSCGADMRGESE